MNGVVLLGIIIFLTIFIVLIVITYQLYVKYKDTRININANHLDKKNMKKINIFGSKFFKRLFWIPSILWVLLSVLVIEDLFSILFVVIPVDALILLVWLDISIIITRRALLKGNGIDFSDGDSIIYDEKDISVFKKIRFPLIMTILTFMVGCLLAYTSIGIPFGKALFIIFLASYIPFILFLIITLLCYHFGNQKQVRFVFKAISAIFACLLMYYYIIALFLILAMEAENPVTDVKYYRHYVGGTELTKVFPKKIPDHVENIEFYYAPGFLQAGTNYMLYYVDKDMTADQFNQNYKDKAIWIGHKNEYTEKEGLLAGAFSFAPVDYKDEDTYIIYLADGECDDSGYCNHGKFLLTAYNEKTHEVIFRAESW